MADLIDLDEFKEVLDVGDIYPDATLQEVIDSATALLFPMLTLDRISIVACSVTSNIATFYTLQPCKFYVGQHVQVSGTPTHTTGNRTISEVSTWYFKTDTGDHPADFTKRDLWPRGWAYDNAQSSLYDADPNVRMAAMIIAVDMWAARQTAAGMGAAVDFQPSPYKMGRSIISRVSGLIQRQRDVRGYIG